MRLLRNRLDIELLSNYYFYNLCVMSREWTRIRAVDAIDSKVAVGLGNQLGGSEFVRRSTHGRRFVAGQQ